MGSIIIIVMGEHFPIFFNTGGFFLDIEYGDMIYMVGTI